MISVCMATYNGARYLPAQVESILVQLGSNDEVIVCDDESTDNTLQLLEGIGDKRIKLFSNEVNLGHVKNFEKALALASGDYVALSDQDDIWLPGRLSKMQSIMDSDLSLLLLASNFDSIDSESKKLQLNSNLNEFPSSRFLRILGIFAGKIPYFGCTYLMRKEFVDKCLPFPSTTEAHDVWLALLANSLGKTYHMHEATVARRIHSNNLTPRIRRSILKIIRSRLFLLGNYVAFLLSKL